MTNLIVEVSKYLMILLMAIYTYANFRFFSFPDLERKRKVCARQNRVMFLLHFLAYLVMYLKTEDETLRRMLLVFYIGDRQPAADNFSGPLQYSDRERPDDKRH